MENSKMRKILAILIIIPFIVTGAFLVAAVIAAGIGLIWVGFHFHELVMMVAAGKGAEVAEKLTGEKLTR
jgi:uncharacterized membrane protein